MQRTIPSIVLLSFFVLAFTSVRAFSQVPLSGAVFDGAGGPLLSGTVYHSTGLQVPAGQTLTVQPGAIVKFSSNAVAEVSGTLLVQANAANRAIFTSLPDDSAGGDTNGGGMSTGSPGSWRGLGFLTGGVGTVTGLEIRFCGASFVPVVRLGSTPGTSLTDCVLTNHAGPGLDYGVDGVAVITGCAFNNGSKPVVNARLEVLSAFTNNTATGNSSHDSIEVGPASVTGPATVPASSMLSGTILLTGSTNIDMGGSLTVDAGVVFKITQGAYLLTVNGTLTCNGTSGSPVVFTVFEDDDHGGDTNKNGPSNGTFAVWRGLLFNDGADASVLQNAIIRYTGSSFVSAVRMMDADIFMDSCTVSESSGDGIDLLSSSSLPTISNSQIQNVRSAVVRVTLESIQNFSNNTASGCADSEAINCPQSTLTNNVSLSPSNLINSVLVQSSSLTISAGVKLTLASGVIVKVSSGATLIQVDGELTCLGTAGNEVVFTTFTDDSFGGDTNTDGASVGSAAFWRGLNFSSTSGASNLNFARIRYCGSSFVPAVRVSGADITLTNSVIEDCAGEGISLQNILAFPTVSGCAIDRCRVAVADIFIDSLAGFTSNTATANTQRNSIKITASNVTGTVNVIANNLINGGSEVVGGLSVDAMGQLILGPGVVLKFSGSAQLLVQGTLIANGSLANPVVFTSLLDDDYGGDTNNNGPSVGAPAIWRGIRFNPGSDASTLDQAILRFSGSSFVSGITIDGANVTLTNTTVSDCFAAALNFTNSGAKPLIRNCDFKANNRAVDGARWENLENFIDNTASGNAIHDCPVVDRPLVTGNTVVRARSMMNGAFVTGANIALDLGTSLTFDRGCVIKVSSSISFQDNLGSLNVLGTGVEPVVFTVFADDDYSGDTNKNGPSAGSKAAWRGFQFSGVTASRMEYAIVRYCGSSFLPAVQVVTNAASLKSVAAEHALSDGFEIHDAAGPCDNLVAYDCAIGIDMNGSSASFDLRFASVTTCATGVRIGNNHLGTLQGCNIWGNTTNYLGATASNLFDSNGSAALVGMNGNINADPLFVDALSSISDLRLQFASPCIDAANFGLGMTVAADHLESSRLNDHDLDGNVGCDMGAFEFSNYTMAVAGQPILGQTLTFTLMGLPGIGQICTALLDGTSYFSPFGMVLVGTPATVLLEDLVYEGYGYPIMVPNNAQFVGIEFGVQMGGAALGDTTTGNITNLYRGVVQD